MKDSLIRAVSVYRPGYDETAPGDPITNTRLLWSRAATPETALNATEDDLFHYAFSSHDELIAGMLTPRVREVLNRIELRDEVTGKISTAWEQLKRKFLQYLGIQVKEGSALDHYLTHVMELASPGTERGDKNYYSRDSESMLDTEGGSGVLYNNRKFTFPNEEKKKNQKSVSSTETEVPISTLLSEAQKAYDASQNRPLLTLEQAKEKGRRTSRSPKDSDY